MVVEGAFVPHHVPLLLAATQGHFDRAGIQATVEPGLGANMVAVLVGQRAFDLGHLPANAAAAAIARGMRIRMVALYQPRSTLALVGIKGRVRLDGASSVEGLRVGITPGSQDAMALGMFRRAQSIGISALTITPIGRSNRLSELVEGRVDVVVGDGAALRARLLARGQEPEVLELAQYGVPLLGLGFVASQALLTSNPDLARRALAAIRAGFAEAAADPPAACRATRAGYGLADSDAACTAALTIFLAHVTPPASPDWGRQSDEAWQRMIEAMRAAGELQGTRPSSFYFTNAVVP